MARRPALAHGERIGHSGAPATAPSSGDERRPADAGPAASGNITLRVPPSLHGDLLQQAKSRGTTVRAVILAALRKDGFKIAEDDIMDRRTPDRVGRKPKVRPESPLPTPNRR